MNPAIAHIGRSESDSICPIKIHYFADALYDLENQSLQPFTEWAPIKNQISLF
jgi:hypothetical protein